MKKSSYFLALIAALMFSSCVHEERKLSQNIPGKIRLPHNFEIYNSGLKKEDFNPGNKSFSFRIFTTINVSCATCIQKLNDWDKFQKDAVNCTQVLLIPVCVSEDKFELIKYLFENNKVGEVNFPLLLDSSQTFEGLNKQFANNMGSISILTNADNEVLLTGNPIANNADRQKFLDRICNNADSNNK